MVNEGARGSGARERWKEGGERGGKNMRIQFFWTSNSRLQLFGGACSEIRLLSIRVDAGGQIGTLVYARVSLTSRDMDPELECFDPASGKSDGFGELKGGLMVFCSLQICRQ